MKPFNYKIIYEYNLDFGSGWTGLKPFDQVKGRNYVINKLKKIGAKYIIQCDSDEWFSPEVFQIARNTNKSMVFQEILWIDKDHYVLGYKHLRGAPASSSFRHVYRNKDNWYDERNPSRHSLIKCNTPSKSNDTTFLSVNLLYSVIIMSFYI